MLLELAGKGTAAGKNQKQQDRAPKEGRRDPKA